MTNHLEPESLDSAAYAGVLEYCFLSSGSTPGDGLTQKGVLGQQQNKEK